MEKKILKIIELFKKNPSAWYNVSQIIDESKLSPEDVKEALSALMEQGKLKTKQDPEAFRTYYQLE